MPIAWQPHPNLDPSLIFVVQRAIDRISPIHLESSAEDELFDISSETYKRLQNYAFSQRFQIVIEFCENRLTVGSSFHTYFLTRPSTRYQCRDSTRILDTNLMTRLDLDLEPSQNSGSRLDPPSNRKFRIQWKEILITTSRSFSSRISIFRIHENIDYY